MSEAALPVADELPEADELPIVGLENVSVRLNDQDILRDITLQVPRGQTLVVIGESGCGKTVTLKMLVGLMTPTSGRVYLDGKPLEQMSDRELARQRLRIGFLFQGAALFDSMDVFDNVAFGPRAKGVPEKEMADIVHRRLAEVGLRREDAAKMPAEISGGMKKRVGLARALALDPEVMLYDEPTTGLDPIMTDVINELILRTRRENPVTSVVVTHEMRTVEKVADRVVMLHPLRRLAPGEPQILFDGTVSQLRACPESRVRQFVMGVAGDRVEDIEGD